MNERIDQRLGNLLREDAPPARDVRFRIALVERQARQRFRQQARRRAVVFAVLALLPGAALWLAEQPAVALLLAALGGLFLTGLRVVVATRQAWRWASGSTAMQRLS